MTSQEYKILTVSTIFGNIHLKHSYLFYASSPLFLSHYFLPITNVKHTLVF